MSAPLRRQLGLLAGSNQHPDIGQGALGSWQEGLPQYALKVVDLRSVLGLEGPEEVAAQKYMY